MYRKRIALAVAAACLAAPAAQAGEREDLELLRQTTTNLIEALVDKGILPREAADDLITKAQKKATATVSAQKAQEGKTVRVAYVPESVKAELREQIKQDVLAQAKNERWGDPGALPEWMDRIQWEGDIRVRYQADKFDKSNSAPSAYLPDSSTAPISATRFPEAADGWTLSPYGFNLLEDRNRIRLRARLGVLAKISPMVSAGIRLSTGNTTDRVSTNQTIGQNFNKYTAVFDRAYLRLDPAEWLSISGGRMPNPWFGTDLVWDEDLNFEGVAATFKPKISPRFAPFITVGAFPLREDDPSKHGDNRWLFGAQVGAQWDLSSNTRSKFGVAVYDYQNIEGKRVPDSEFVAGAYTSSNSRRYEYPSNLRQKGNTLFTTNALADPGAAIWGLASKFRVLNITGSLDLARWDPVHLVITGDYAKNLGYDREEMQRRTGMTLAAGKDTGWQVKTTLGMPRVKEYRDWQVSLAYRYLGSDAVLDAFTDSDYNLGGTNHKGYVLGFSYGIDRNTAFNLRWLSFDSLSSTTMMTPGGKFSTDVLQADVSASF